MVKYQLIHYYSNLNLKRLKTVWPKLFRSKGQRSFTKNNLIWKVNVFVY